MKFTTITVAAIVAAGAAWAEPVAPADVVYTEDGTIAASLSGVPGDAANGSKVLSSKGDGNCLACHEVTALKDIPFHGEVGPMLDGAGDRWSAEQLRGILSDSKRTFPDTVMPAFYKVDGFNRPGDGYTGKAATGPLDPLLTAQDIEDVVAFLLTLKD